MDGYMLEIIRIAVEENSTGVMVHLVDMPGAFTRAKKVNDAIQKVPGEAAIYGCWSQEPDSPKDRKIQIIQRDTTNAHLEDGDT
jgi:hypothetical protein